jgi:hypothetical protein
VLFAFLVASLAAAMVMLIGVALPIWQDVLTPGVEQGVFSVIAGFGAIFISAVAMLPAMIVVGIAEAFRLRSFLFYAACGALGMLWLYYGMGFAPAAGPPVAREFEIVAAAGIAAGLVYWLIAGRNAGRWQGLEGKRRPPPAAT